MGATTLTHGRGWHILSETKWLQNDLSHEGCTAYAPQQCSLRASTPKIGPGWLGKSIRHAPQVSATHGVQVHTACMLAMGGNSIQGGSLLIAAPHEHNTLHRVGCDVQAVPDARKVALHLSAATSNALRFLNLNVVQHFGDAFLYTVQPAL